MMQNGTTFPLKRLLVQIKERLVSTGIRGHVIRVDMTRKGAVHLELALAERRCWYGWENHELTELEAANDSKIPLAARLKDPSFAASTTLLSYRPGRRLTLVDHSGQKPRVLKGFRRGQIDRMARKYEVAYAAFSGCGVRAPEVIEHNSADETLAIVFKAGERLRLSADNMDLFHLVGEGLRDFQTHDALADESVFESKDELQVIDRHAARLAQVGGELPAQWQALRERLNDAWVKLPPAVIGLTHRDLHDKQFVQQADHLTLLDFDLMTRADVALDPANFLVHLALRDLQDLPGASQRSIDICGKKFLQGLARNEEPGFWERLRFYQASAFCRLALIYALRPRWADLMPNLTAIGNRCLDDMNRIKET